MGCLPSPIPRALRHSTPPCCFRAPPQPKISTALLPTELPLPQDILLLDLSGQPGQSPRLPGILESTLTSPQNSEWAQSYMSSPPPPSFPGYFSIPNCLESLGLPFPWKPDPPRSHTDSAGLEGVSSWPESYPSFPLSRDFQTHPWGEGALQRSRGGAWRAATAGGDGGLQGEAGSRKEGQFPRVER